MIDIEKYMESFKESISKRIEKQEENFKNLFDKGQCEVLHQFISIHLLKARS